MIKYKLAILRNEIDSDHLLWEKACNDYSGKIDYDVINLTENKWLEKCLRSNYDFYLAVPSCISSQFKQLYDERITILCTDLGLPIYPTLKEILFYENKRFFSFWLEANKLPHPSTNIFYNKNEATDFILKTEYPIVGKLNIGASGSGIDILKNKDDAKKYLDYSFSSQGLRRRWGPNFKKGNLLKRGYHYMRNPSEFKNKILLYKKNKRDIQNGFVIFQKYIKHSYEWRIVVIGDSFFAHKKLKIGEKASGSLQKNYDNPPTKLFDFAKNIMEKFNLFSQAIDVFESDNDQYLINEMQCIFGQSDQYQMQVDGKPGRYKYIDQKWIFESGDFNKNESYNLRVENVLQILDNQKNNRIIE